MGSELKGKGQADAVITSWLERNGAGTKMRISQDINLSGPLAQYGRGMIQDVSGSLMDEFCRADPGRPVPEERGTGARLDEAEELRQRRQARLESPSSAGSAGSSRSCSAKTGAET